ncbi:MAG TPA: HD domain-containing phosphohydrolase [Steroidobacteraceae bacterium]|nr:HD domain-containing phosphohydrolase [Steroidobacteraceae bacterium]
MATILIVDDRKEHRTATRLVLERAGHRVLETADGEGALQVARRERPDLVLSDVLMPGMDGFALCRRAQEDPDLRAVPFVLMTGMFADPRYKEFAAEVGAVDVLQKPLDSKSLRDAVDAALRTVDAEDTARRIRRLDERAFHQRHVEAVNAKLEQQMAELELANAQLRASEFRMREVLGAVVEAITKMVEYRDPYTTGHERRVGALATAIGQEMGIAGDVLDGLRIGGYLHDVGKIAMPSEILTKPGRLSDVEMALLRSHAQIGYDILSGIDFPWRIAEMARQHHERINGTGYPRGLAGSEILLEARIIAVADTVEAMTSHRPYRPGKGLADALAEIEQGRDVLYDAAPVDACLQLFREGRFSFQ